MDMSLENWLRPIEPKVKGTWNLHQALEGIPHDFFLLTSSISGSVGTATEGNYCAGNAFQDAFARYRRGKGLPATAIGLGMISEVGYLAEHPEIESLLLRRGVHPISESEFLSIVDTALSQPHTTEHEYGRKHFVEGHLLTGLEAHGLNAQRLQNFEGNSYVLRDPRSFLIARTLRTAERDDTTVMGSGLSDRSMPESIATVWKNGDLDDATRVSRLQEEVQKIVTVKLCNLLLLREDQLGPQTYLSTFGLDSMLAAELRSYLYHTFEADLSFLMLLDKKANVTSLAKVIVETMLQSNTKETGSASREM